MSTRILQVRLALLLALLSPLAAMAQNWSVVHRDGVAVMEEISKLTFEVRNTAGGTRPLTEVTLAFTSNYDMDSAEGPTGWTATVNRSGRRVVFRVSGSCPLTGIAPGGSALFSVRVAGLAAARDQAGEAFVSSQKNSLTNARDFCANVFFNNPDLSAASWRRVGISTSLQVSPRALGVGGEVATQILVENRTTGPQAGLQFTSQASLGSANFQVGSTTPASLSLDLGGSGVLSARATATSAGTAILQGIVGNGGGQAASSQVAQALQVSVSPLAATLDLSPLQVFTTSTVTLRLRVSNTSATNTYRNITPRAPVPAGTAVSQLLSGPVPASVAALAPGETAQFVWQYRVTGAEGAGYSFRAQADATLAGAGVTTDLVSSAEGRVVLILLTAAPEVIQSGSNVTVRYTLENRGTENVTAFKLFRPAPSHFTAAASPFVETPAGWTPTSDASGFTWAVPAGQTGLARNGRLTVGLVYASVGGVTADTPFMHRMQLTRGGTRSRVDTTLTVLAPKVVPEVQGFTVVSGSARNTLIWTNPPDHNGVVVLRSTGAAPNLPPAVGARYATGNTLGNATVVHASEMSVTSRLVDTAVTNGTEYFYRVYNMDDLRRYSAGNVPTSFGVRARPQARGVGTPLWCYNVGMSALQQPITETGVGIYSAFNDSVIANRTNVATPTEDGDERWRPVRLLGTIGGRFPVVPLRGLTGQYLMVGTQDGYMYALNSQTGDVLWRGDGGQALGKIQALPVTQLHDFANAAYQAAHPGRDLVFFATRIDGDTAGNKVIALNAATGQRVWIYQPGNLDMVSGGMMVDYANNRLYVPARSAGNTQHSLRILNTLTGQQVASLPLGDIEFSVVRLPATNQALVTAKDGRVTAVGLTSMAVEWTMTLPGTPTNYARPQGRGFLATLQSGLVEYYLLNVQSSGTTAVRQWSTPVPNPTGAFTYVKDGKTYAYVGSSNGRVYELDVATGAVLKHVSLGASQLIGTPTVDFSVGRLHVGTQDGRVCAFQVPFP